MKKATIKRRKRVVPPAAGGASEAGTPMARSGSLSSMQSPMVHNQPHPAGSLSGKSDTDGSEDGENDAKRQKLSLPLPHPSFGGDTGRSPQPIDFTAAYARHPDAPHLHQGPPPPPSSSHPTRDAHADVVSRTLPPLNFYAEAVPLPRRNQSEDNQSKVQSIRSLLNPSSSSSTATTTPPPPPQPQPQHQHPAAAAAAAPMGATGTPSPHAMSRSPNGFLPPPGMLPPPAAAGPDHNHIVADLSIPPGIENDPVQLEAYLVAKRDEAYHEYQEYQSKMKRAQIYLDVYSARLDRFRREQRY
ncbi:hypothetical protein YB2330_000624 [Saitoella coloradoensis]